MQAQEPDAANQVALVTGSTGLVGFNVCRALLRRSARMKLLVRDPRKGVRMMLELLRQEGKTRGDESEEEAAQLLREHNIELVQGDTTQKSGVVEALRGCSRVYHVAGLPEQWLKDASLFERVNVEGTRNVLEASIEHKEINLFVYTSTIDVFQGSCGQRFDESIIDPEPKGTAYERSKQSADQLVWRAHSDGLIPCIFIHPAALYGPGPAGSPGVNQFIVDLNSRKVPMLLPGGMPVVYGPDVGEVHVLAAEKARPGSRFIVSEEYYTLRDLAAKVCEELPSRPKVPKVMGLWVAKLVSAVTEAVSKHITHSPPLLPKGQLHFLQWGAIPDSSKAKRELAWEPVALPDGLRRTIAFMRETSRDFK